MSDVQPSDDVDFDSEVPLLIIGAGAAGLCAALAASEAGVEPVVIERDAVPSGSTALSAGLIPAAGTRFQAAQGIADIGGDFRRRHRAQGAWRGGREARARGRGRRRTAGRMAERGLRDAVRGDHRLQLSGPFGASHARAAEPHRRRADRPAAQRGGSARDPDPCRARRRDAVRRRGRVRRRRRDARPRRRARDASAAARWCSPATAMAATRRWCGATSPRWATRSTSAIPGNQGDAVLWGEALGARLAHLSGLSGARLGRDAAQHPDHLGGDHGGRLSGQRAGAPLLQRGARLFGSSRRGAAPAGRHRVRYFRCAHRGRGAAVRGFQECREGGRADRRPTRSRRLAARIGVPADALRSEFDAIALRQAGSLRPHLREAAGRAVLRHQGDRRAVPHAGRARDRYAPRACWRATASRSQICSRPAARRSACRARRRPGYLSGNGLLTATVFGRIAGTSAARL